MSHVYCRYQRMNKARLRGAELHALSIARARGVIISTDKSAHVQFMQFFVIITDVVETHSLPQLAGDGQHRPQTTESAFL